MNVPVAYNATSGERAWIHTAAGLGQTHTLETPSLAVGPDGESAYLVGRAQKYTCDCRCVAFGVDTATGERLRTW
jgi:hypothetical protein